MCLGKDYFNVFHQFTGDLIPKVQLFRLVLQKNIQRGLKNSWAPLSCEWLMEMKISLKLLISGFLKWIFAENT